MGAFEYRQAEEIRDALATHGVRYLFLGKSGAILLGFPDTTQDADVFIAKSTDNCRALIAALRDLKFSISAQQAADIERGKDFVQLKHGPFDLDLIFAPDGIERFEDAWQRRVEVEASPFAIWTTSSPASRRPDELKTVNRCRDSSRSENIGFSIKNDARSLAANTMVSQ